MAARSHDVEILVHINAPSRAVDDVQYRQLAEAYLNFESTRCTSLPPLKDQEKQHSQGSSCQGTNNGSQGGHGKTVPSSSSQEYATPAAIPLLLDSQDLSFQSALDNRESPRLGDTTVGIILGDAISPSQTSNNGTQVSWRAPPSEVGDSYPLPDPSLLRGSPSKVLERYLRSSTRREDSIVPSSASHLPDEGLSQPRGHRAAALSSPPHLVEVPSSQPARNSLPMISSSISPPIKKHEEVPVSSAHERDDTEVLIPTSGDALDATHVSSSPIFPGPAMTSPQKEAPAAASEDSLGVSHITSSLIGDDPCPGIEQETAIVSAQLSAPDDALDVTHISSSSFADLSGAAQSQKQGPPAVLESLLDVTHISVSSLGESPDAAPSQKRDLSPRDDEAFDLTHVSSSPFEPISSNQPDGFRSPVAKKRRRSQDSSPSLSTTDGAAKIIFADLKLPSANPQPVPPSSLEIMPPSPPAGLLTLHPDDLVPPQLSKLACDLSSRYRSSPPARDINPLERGYWLLDCDSWSAAGRDSTWAFLRRYVCSGLAGWGLWCRREERPHRFVKVYCWGHLVKHAYLLLYLASERRLKGTGAVWIDADGEAVITVPAYGK